MRGTTHKNINTPEYFDVQFADKHVDMENTLRQDTYIKILTTYGKIGLKSSIIELGCGVSSFLPQMAARTGELELYGIDFTPKTIERLKKQYPIINYAVGDVRETLSIHPDYFDAVVAGELIEHLEQPEKLVDEMVRICKPGGVVLLSTPQLEFDDPEHLWEFDAVDIFHMLSKYCNRVYTEVLESEKFPGRKYIFGWGIKI